MQYMIIQIVSVRSMSIKDSDVQSRTVIKRDFELKAIKLKEELGLPECLAPC